jgi:hypothetical protein
MPMGMIVKVRINMKVKELMEALSKLNPEEHVCALVYDKSIWTDILDESESLSDEIWERICNIFDENGFNDVFDSIDEHVNDLVYDV